ncbi:MD-2-related lipid-recognition protein-like [Melitaea cinxia]|uniref:MD-2-related lipid-recognition protein-like n=1 Tax=Melitaea cinxia TaxID=113334 RepID=UPI001E273193|nr:MD-2-related lipid-recognition protein-like [Melitaea cinxia]XP_045451832.1 MD-2-related lipid-recognition protein-like [Melitaea cinxia]
MDARLVVFFLFCVFSFINSEYVNRKFCKDVNPNKCSIHSVKMDPCPDGPGFCLLRRNKPYTLAFDFTPRFEANKLMLSIVSDNQNTGSFDTVVTPPVDACEYSSCPLEDNVRQVMDIDFVYEKKHYGKFPIQVRLWNENDETEACCFTLNVNVFK